MLPWLDPSPALRKINGQAFDLTVVGTAIVTGTAKLVETAALWFASPDPGALEALRGPADIIGDLGILGFALVFAIDRLSKNGKPAVDPEKIAASVGEIMQKRYGGVPLSAKDVARVIDERFEAHERKEREYREMENLRHENERLLQRVRRLEERGP